LREGEVTVKKGKKEEDEAWANTAKINKQGINLLLLKKLTP
jgi:hypothetical protein